MSQQYSETIEQFGPNPIYVKASGSHDQLTPFLKQIYGLLTEAYKYSQTFTTPVYDHLKMSSLLDSIDQLIRSNSGILTTDALILSTVRELNANINAIYALCSPSANFIASMAQPFPLWHVGVLYERCPARVRVRLTGGILDDNDLKAYVGSPNPNNPNEMSWLRLTTVFIDKNTVTATNIRGRRVIFIRQTPHVDSPSWRSVEEMNQVLRRIFLRTLEAGWLMNRTSQTQIIGNSEGVITRIEWRDRIVEKPVEVIKEVVREVPGPERIVEKIVTVPGPVRDVVRTEAAGIINVHSRPTFAQIPDGTEMFVYKVAGGLITEAGIFEKQGNSVVASATPKTYDIAADGAKILWALEQEHANPTDAPRVYPLLYAVQNFKGDSGQFVKWDGNNPFNAAAFLQRNVPAEQPQPKPQPQPQPQPQPKPQPKPPSQFMSLDYKRLIIDREMGKNRVRVRAWENDVNGAQRNGGGGQGNGAAVVQGGRPRMDPDPGWFWQAYQKAQINGQEVTVRSPSEARAAAARDYGIWMDILEPWGIFCRLTDSVEWGRREVVAEARNYYVFVLRRGATRWERILLDKTPVNWSNAFYGNMNSHGRNLAIYNSQGRFLGEGDPDAPDKVGSEVPHEFDRVCHFGADRVNPGSDVEAVLFAVECRIRPDAKAGARVGLQMGGDYKMSNSANNPGPHWFPGIGCSAITELTREWRRYSFVTIAGVQDAVPVRVISQERFLSTEIELPDDEFSFPDGRIRGGSSAAPTEDWRNNTMPSRPSGTEWVATAFTIETTTHVAASDTEQSE